MSNNLVLSTCNFKKLDDIQAWISERPLCGMQKAIIRPMGMENRPECVICAYLTQKYIGSKTNIHNK